MVLAGGLYVYFLFFLKPDTVRRFLQVAVPTIKRKGGSTNGYDRSCDVCQGGLTVQRETPDRGLPVSGQDAAAWSAGAASP